MPLILLINIVLKRYVYDMFGIYVTIPVMYSITHITKQMRTYEHRSTSFYWNVLYDKNNKQIRHDSDDAEIGVIPYAILLSKRRGLRSESVKQDKRYLLFTEGEQRENFTSS